MSIRKVCRIHNEESDEALFLCTFFYQLEKAGIKYCVLRNYQTLPDSLGGSDLDILIHRTHIKTFYDILLASTEKAEGKVLVKYGALSPQYCLSGKYQYWWGVQIDIFEGTIPYKVFPTIDAGFILSRSKKYNNISVANDKDAAIIAFLKEILNNGVCNEKFYNAAQTAYRSDEKLYEEQIIKSFGNEFSFLINELFNNNFSEPEILKLSKTGRKNLRKGLNSKIKVLKGDIKKFYRFFSPPGFSVAILGCDGSGKTTVIDHIKEPLSQAVHNSLYYEHMRPNLIPNIAQFFGKKKNNGPTINPHSSKPSGKFGSLLRLFYYSFDYIVGYWIKIYPATVKKSCIWLFDRYYYDYLIDPLRGRINLPKWLIKIIGFIIPSPDLILCLGADSEIIHNRKPELSKKEIKRQVSELKIFYRNHNKAVWIDTGGSIEESFDQAMIAITTNMAKRYDG